MVPYRCRNVLYFSGWLYDLTLNYHLPYIVMGCVGLVSTVLSAWCYVLHKRSQAKFSDTTKQPNSNYEEHMEANELNSFKDNIKHVEE